MCFTSSPPQECLSKDVFDPFIIDEDRLLNGFINIHLEPVELVESTSEESEEDQPPSEFEIIPYQISNAPAAYLDALSILNELNAPWPVR